MNWYETGSRVDAAVGETIPLSGETPDPSPVDPDAITEFNITAIVAMACLTALEFAALVTGHDGAFMLPMAAIIGGLAGYKIPKGLFGGK